jgi:hypothetical protein
MASAEEHVCIACHLSFPRSEYSKNQWSKVESGKCAKCINTSLPPIANKSRSSEETQTTTKKPLITQSIVNIKIVDRDQCDIPGFDGLTCCKDWPQLKKGEPPLTNSSVFNPLIACALGPIPGHSTKNQIEFATEWWSKALPAWPRWVKELQEAGLGKKKDALLSRSKGNPNLLIPKGRGYGTVPHFRGKDQVDSLELVPMVSIEVYACITCMYSQAALERSNNQ